MAALPTETQVSASPDALCTTVPRRQSTPRASAAPRAIGELRAVARARPRRAFPTADDRLERVVCSARATSCDSVALQRRVSVQEPSRIKRMAKPESEFDVDVATNVMESGLLRVLTKESAAAPPAEDTVETALPPAPPDPTMFVSALPPPAPRRRGSRVMRVALAVAVAVLAADVAMVAFHERHRLKLPPPPPLPTYRVLPPAPTPPPEAATPVAATPVVAAPIVAAPAIAAPVVAADPAPLDAAKHGHHHHRARH